MTVDFRSDEGREETSSGFHLNPPASIRDDDVLRIVLVGKTGAGKSATGNTILGSGAFPSEMSAESVTDSCKKASGVVAFRKVSLVDTPGLFDTRFSEDENLKKISDCISLAAPGPHAFLLVIKLGRFTDEEQRSVEMIQKVFGQKSDQYTMVLFTSGDQLKGKPVEEMLTNCPKLQKIVSKCNGGYHVFNNETKDPSQVNELLENINQMLNGNGGSHYTNEMFQEAARKIEEEKERERREMEEKRLAEREELKEQLRKEVREEGGEEKNNTGRDIGVLGAITETSAAAGGAVGAAVAVLVETAGYAAAASVAGPVGVAVGGALGLAIGGVFLLYRYHKNRKTSEEKKPLINDEKSTSE